MKRTSFIITFSTFIFLFACDNLHRQTENGNVNQNIDTTNAIKIGNYWAIPKGSFKFNSLIEGTEDTLSFVTCADYVYSPFGAVDKKSEIERGLLKNFSVSNKVFEGIYEFQILKLKSSRLILFIEQAGEAAEHSYIFKGEINDTDVNLIEGIKIGMPKVNFIKTFFENFPKELIARYNIIAFESCVTDLRHTYTFKDEKLYSINFKTHSHWTMDY